MSRVTMTTYLDDGYQYFYDSHTKMWTIYKVDQGGCQIGDADYHSNRKVLKLNYPDLKFKIT